MTSTILRFPQPPLQRVSALLRERRVALAARRQHATIMQDPRTASEHTAAITWAETNGRGGCPYCR
jgi:hypothetical protein